jgi:ubiquitin thioesterase OTU1
VLLFSGFPPAAIAYSSPEDLLSTLGVSSGSVVIVRDKPIIVRRVVEADNSCLFHALSYAVGKDRSQHNAAYRAAVAKAILADSDRYSEAMLGRPPVEYANWITRESSWGGEIELGILSVHLRLEIAAVDVQTNNVYIYSPDDDTAGGGEGGRIYVMYDGIHYDVLVYAKSEEAPESSDVAIFHSADLEALEACKAKARDLCQKRQFVDLGGFEITCMVCNQGFHGQKEAAEHAKLTSHQNFSQK